MHSPATDHSEAIDSATSEYVETKTEERESKAHCTRWARPAATHHMPVPTNSLESAYHYCLPMFGQSSTTTTITYTNAAPAEALEAALLRGAHVGGRQCSPHLPTDHTSVTRATF